MELLAARSTRRFSRPPAICCGRENRGPAHATPAQLTFSVGFQVGWELDFWGKFRRSIEAADASYFASIAQYDDLQVLMAAQVAAFYVSIRTLEARLVIARENAVLQKRSLDIAERLFKGGNDSELDVQQAKAQYFGTLATIPPLESALRQTQNALSTLLVRAPGPLPEMAAGKDVIPQAELAVIVDMPAELLRRRPDVRAAELLLAAQSALIGVSVADLYPSISLLGSVGLSATSLERIVACADLGRRAEPCLERLRLRAAHQRRAGAGCAIPAALRAVSRRAATGGSRGR